MKAYVFPGQGSQFEGMGKELYEKSALAKSLFDAADEILGFPITSVMFTGSDEDLKQTKVTQPAVFLHSVITAKVAGEAFQPAMVAGHSLGELSALVAAGAISFEDGLQLVYQRALAMQKACEAEAGTMAAVLGLEDSIVEAGCEGIAAVVVPANYNCPGQLVISGSIAGVEAAVEKLKELGASRALILAVGGAFHSPLMAPAREELMVAIEKTPFATPICPIYQNVDAKAQTDPTIIQQNLIEQLTAPVRWTQTMLNMQAAGMTEYIEVGGTGKVLQGFIKRVDRRYPSSSLSIL
ncbi:MAG: ACP S-malonyltransferase [Saprospiraceae bacterium]